MALLQYVDLCLMLVHAVPVTTAFAANGRLAFGADYNPEQWPRKTWEEDVVLMREAGVNLVNVAVFAWALLEPEPGRFEFGWLDEVLDGLAATGIRVNLANATASPPPWFSYLHPETLPVTSDGYRLSVGSRQAYCPSSPAYRDAAIALTTRIAERYRHHPALAMWHVNNEIGCHNARCYCDVSAARFREWLADRYGDVEALNGAWSTSFWSQRYRSWAEVMPPRRSPTFVNPAQQLDFARFSSEACLAVFRAERNAIRAVAPELPITTNIMVTQFQKNLDYSTWAGEVDILANCHYLDASDPEGHIELAFAADQCRGLAGDTPWMVMEHSTSAVNWQPRNVAKEPGEMLRNTLQHIARGADGAMFFQWRASRAGAEKYHSAMVPHAGTDTKVWREVVELGGVIKRLGEIVGTRPGAATAMIVDWESWWGAELDAHPSVDVSYLDRAHALYRALWRLGITVDVVPSHAELSRYELVIVPTLYMATQEVGARLERFVADGGTAVVTYFSGIVDHNDRVYPGGYPGAFRKWLGVRVEEFFPLRSGETVKLDDGSRADVWTEALELDGADAVARYADGPLSGVPAVTVNAYGQGRAWYLATRLDDASTQRLVKRIVAETGIRSPIPMVTAPQGLEVVRREGPSGSYLFLINHGTETAHIAAHGHDLVADRAVERRVSLRAGDAAVIRETER